MVKDKRPVTDMNDLIDLKLDQRMKSYVVYNAEEHQQTREKFHRLEQVIHKRESNRVHNVIQDFIIAVLLFFTFTRT